MGGGTDTRLNPCLVSVVGGKDKSVGWVREIWCAKRAGVYPLACIIITLPVEFFRELHFKFVNTNVIVEVVTFFKTWSYDVPIEGLFCSKPKRKYNIYSLNIKIASWYPVIAFTTVTAYCFYPLVRWTWFWTLHSINNLWINININTMSKTHTRNFVLSLRK